MNRAERRRQQRNAEKKTKDKLSTMKKLCGRSEKTDAVDWALKLGTKEQEYLSFMMTENSKHDLQVYVDAYTVSLGCNLDDEELIKKIQDDVYKEGLKVKEYRDNGGDYIMSLQNNTKAIINDYEKGISKNIKESELIKDLSVNYKASVNAIKSIVKDYKKSKQKPCSSKTCPFQKGDKCTNETVLSGKGECQQLNVNDVKATKDTEIVTKKEKIFKYIENFKSIDKHSEINRDELYSCMVNDLNISRNTARKYYSLYNKQNVKPDPLAKVKTEVRKELREKVEEVPKNEEIKPIENNKKSKYKIIKEVVKRDIQGEHGVYHIENGVMKIEDTVYTKADDVKQDYSDTVQDIELEYQETVKKAEELRKERMDSATSSKDEALEIMEEFM